MKTHRAKHRTRWTCVGRKKESKIDIHPNHKKKRYTHKNTQVQCSFDANYENAEFDTVLNKQIQNKQQQKTEEEKTTHKHTTQEHGEQNKFKMHIIVVKKEMKTENKKTKQRKSNFDERE